MPSGCRELDDAWNPSDDLRDALYDLGNRAIAARLSDPLERERYQLHEVMKLDANGQPWTATVMQSCALPDVRKSVLGAVWYDRKIGVCVRMLGEPGTPVYVGRTPVGPKPESAAGRRQRGEQGGEVRVCPTRLAGRRSWSGAASRRPFSPRCTSRSRRPGHPLVGRGLPLSAA